jgi:hypothetical protein
MGKGRTVSTRKRTTLIATAVCLELVAVFLYSMTPVSVGEVVTPTHNVSNVAPPRHLTWLCCLYRATRTINNSYKPVNHAAVANSKRRDGVGTLSPALIERTP